jgi:hypothetical protein
MKDRRLLNGCSRCLPRAALLFDFPLLRVWLSEGTVFGLPLLPVALFVAWAG